VVVSVSEAYSSTLKMEAICSFETSVGFQRTTRRYIPEDRTLYNRRRENLRSYGWFVANRTRNTQFLGADKMVVVVGVLIFFSVYLTTLSLSRLHSVVTGE
jgi:hypothetical protein